MTRSAFSWGRGTCTVAVPSQSSDTGLTNDRAVTPGVIPRKWYTMYETYSPQTSHTLLFQGLVCSPIYVIIQGASCDGGLASGVRAEILQIENKQESDETLDVCGRRKRSRLGTHSLGCEKSAIELGN